MGTKLEKITQQILEPAGITVNGNNPWDIQVHNYRFYKRILTQGSLGLGESYMDCWWDTKDTMSLHLFFERILRAKVDKKAAEHLSSLTKLRLFGVKLLDRLPERLYNRQTISKSRKVGEQHYDVGNELFRLMLDKRLVYSCANFRGIENQRDIDRAQENKLDLDCRKAELKPGMRVIDIGCGSGSFLKYAAEKYGVKGVGVNISEEQVKLAQELCKGLPIDIRGQDYRDVNEKFDAAVSFGMAEHVGRKNHRGFYQKISDCLVPGGKFLYHAIGKNTSEFTADPFITKYIFPGGELLSLSQMIEPSEGIFNVRDVENIGRHYDPTLICWDERFMGNWEKIKRLGNGKYNESFKNMWHYYLSSCASAFRVGNLQVYQIVFEKPGFNVDYQSVR